MRKRCHGAKLAPPAAKFRKGMVQIDHGPVLRYDPGLDDRAAGFNLAAANIDDTGLLVPLPAGPNVTTRITLTPRTKGTSRNS